MQRIVRAERRGPAVAPSALVEARAELVSARAELAAERLEAARARQALHAELVEQTREIALLAAQHIVQAELALKPERIAEIVTGLLARVRRAERAVVRAHPDDLPALSRMCEEHGLAHVTLEPDETLARGGCIVATPIGTLDASLETRLDALRSALKKAAATR
jgi:flagellar assembly protein FliH